MQIMHHIGRNFDNGGIYSHALAAAPRDLTLHTGRGCESGCIGVCRAVVTHIERNYYLVLLLDRLR